MNSTWQNLRERKIVQWSFAYLAGSWALLQGLDFLAGHFGSWDAFVRAATVFLLVNYAAVIVVAWYHGERGRQRATVTELVLLGIIFTIACSGAVVAARTTPDDDGQLAGAITGRDADNNSIAVLPFANIGGNAEHEYFSDGITEEILDAIAKIPGLRVAARTSSFAFKGKNEDISAIGRKLRVAHVLEGSVQRAGDQVRVTAKLVNAKDGFQVWSQVYTRPAADVFAVEDEISRAIAQQLQTSLASHVVLASKATSNMDAHDLYFRGNDSWSKRTDESIHEAVDYFTRAIRADPGYARAHAGLALALAVLPNYDPDADAAATFARGKDAAHRALQLDSASPEAYAALSEIAQYQDSMVLAERYARRAVALKENYATAHQWLGESLWMQGRLPEARAQMEAALSLDVLSPVINATLCSVKAAAGDYAGGRSSCEIAAALDSSFRNPIGALVQIGLMTKQFEGERGRMRWAMREAGVDYLADSIVDGYMNPAKRPALLRALNHFRDEGAPASMMYEVAGERDLAIAVAKESEARNIPGYTYWPLMAMPGMKALREDPRFPQRYTWPRRN